MQKKSYFPLLGTGRYRNSCVFFIPQSCPILSQGLCDEGSEALAPPVPHHPHSSQEHRSRTCWVGGPAPAPLPPGVSSPSCPRPHPHPIAGWSPDGNRTFLSLPPVPSTVPGTQRSSMNVSQPHTWKFKAGQGVLPLSHTCLRQKSSSNRPLAS